MTVAELDALCAWHNWLLIIGVIGVAVVRKPYTQDMYGKGLLYGFVDHDPQTLADKISEQFEIQASLSARPCDRPGAIRGRGQRR
ncbi:hypothetical protein [Nonomuraea longicatena]|uniref:Uncharacterized protein n=1 Tax=Nonomuraea longicatena TaxID=83682 RepID=A0ABN1NS44_9ACTN